MVKTFEQEHISDSKRTEIRGQAMEWLTRPASSIDESLIIPVQEVLSCLSMMLGQIMA